VSRARALRLAVLILASTLAQATLPATVSWWPAAPALTLALIAAIAWTDGPEAGAVAGFGAGLLLDVVPPAAHPIGQWAAVLAALGYLFALLLRHEERLVPVLLVAAGTVALAPVLYALLGVTLGQTANLGVGSVVAAAGWGLAAALLVLPSARAKRRPEPPLSVGGPLPAGLLEDWERSAA
jgi:rod shape-determining protein MreD